MRTPLLSTAAALTLAVVTLAGCGDDGDPVSARASDPPPTSETSSGKPGSPSGTGTTTASPTDATSDPTTVAAPIYFVGDTPVGPRLYREFRQVESDNPLEEAAALLVAGDALDPDYRTLLSGLQVQSVSDGDGVITVTLGDDSVLSDKAVSPRMGRLAVQSLVYTLQGVAQNRDPVRVVASDGSTPLTLFGVATGDGVEAAKPLTVLSLVSITTPEEGATVTGGTLPVSGVGSSFEATIGWSILDEDGNEVDTYSIQADGWQGHLYPWSDDLDVSDLEPGTYTFVARTDDPTGGEGPGPFEDTRTFTIE